MKKRFKKMKDEELLNLQYEEHKKYANCIIKAVLGMGIFMLLSFIPFGAIYEIFVVLMMLGVLVGNMSAATYHFVKHIKALKELKKRGMSEQSIYEKTEKMINEECEDHELVGDCYMIESVPIDDIGDVFEEFSDNYRNDLNINENARMR